MLSYDIFVFRFYEADIRDLRQSARCGRSDPKNRVVRTPAHSSETGRLALLDVRLLIGLTGS